MNFVDLEKLSNKKFAYTCLSLLENRGAIDEALLNTLTNSQECNRLFSCSGFAILQQVSKTSTDADLINHCYDNTGRQRYYKDIIMLNQKYYVVTNHWYGKNMSMPDNRTSFSRWVLSKIK